MTPSDEPPPAGALPAAARRILVVDDEALFAKAVMRRLARAGHVCDHAASLAAE